MRRVEKPWGYEVIWAETDEYVGKIMEINPGHRMSLQYHEKKEETVYVLKGNLIVWHSNKLEDCKIFGPNEVYHVTPKMIHRFGCAKDQKEPTRIIEVSTNYLSDVIRLEDDYKR
tara:strand:- start:3597 stop:3941 length:345 start_codon:yes stop_codon:yes gene_type:complete